MQLPLDDLHDRPVSWLCRQAGAPRFAAFATAALGAGLATGLVDARAAAACVAVAMVVSADRAYALATRRFDRSASRAPSVALSRLIGAARAEGEDGLWLVRHVGGLTEGMTPSTFRTFATTLARRLERVLMLVPGRAPAWNLEADTELAAPPAATARPTPRERALKREAALSRLTRRPMDCLLLTAWDDTYLHEGRAKLDPVTGILSDAVLPEGKGPLTQAYLAFEGGREYMLDRLPDGRFFVCDMVNLNLELAPEEAPARAV